MTATPAPKQCEFAKGWWNKERSVYKDAEIIEKIVRLKKEKQCLPPSGSAVERDVDQLCLAQAFHGVIRHLA
jgi:hypothetical protein